MGTVTRVSERYQASTQASMQTRVFMCLCVCVCVHATAPTATM